MGKEASRRYRSRWPERVAASHKAHYETPEVLAARKEKAERQGLPSVRALIDAAKNVPCHDCGQRYPLYIMEFDHRDPTRKLFSLSQANGYKRDRVLTEIQKCDVVCANCHRERTWGPKTVTTEDPYIAVDLDGTLAEYHGWSPDIGKPVPAMMARVYQWLHEPGLKVKIFTARASIPGQVVKIEAWLSENGLPALEVTNRKTMFMKELWDDRAVQVIPNTGIAVSVKLK